MTPLTVAALRRIALVMVTLAKQFHDEKEIQKLRDEGRSQDFIDGAHSMFHALDSLLQPPVKAMLLEMMLTIAAQKAEQDEKTKETVAQMDEVDSKIQNPEDISDDIKSMLNRFKGPMQ